jgi:nucleoside-triphosphatase THEP1
MFYLLSMIWVLTGPVQSGKTRFLRGLAAKLKTKKVAVAGFLSTAVYENGRLAGYDLLALKGKRPVPYIRRSGRPGWKKTGPYFFVPNALEKAKGQIRDHRPGDLLIVDEVGPLELRGSGLWPALAEVFQWPEFKALLVVRTACLSVFRRKLGGRRLKIFRVDDPQAPAALLNEIAEVCTRGPVQPASEAERRSVEDVG